MTREASQIDGAWSKSSGERGLEVALQNISKIFEMQFGFIPRKGKLDAIFVVCRILQEYYEDEEEKPFMCFADQEKAFDRGVPKPVFG